MEEHGRHRPDESKRASRVPPWASVLHEEAWGNVCVVETKRGNLHIGFMAVPGKDVLAYIEGLELRAAKATWQVDANNAHILDGAFNGHFDFLALELPSVMLITELAQGSVLTLSVIDGVALTLDVSNARSAFAKLALCHSTNGRAKPAGGT